MIVVGRMLYINLEGCDIIVSTCDDGALQVVRLAVWGISSTIGRREGQNPITQDSIAILPAYSTWAGPCRWCTCQIARPALNASLNIFDASHFKPTPMKTTYVSWIRKPIGLIVGALKSNGVSASVPAVAFWVWDLALDSGSEIRCWGLIWKSSKGRSFVFALSI